MDADTAATIARTYTAAEILRQIDAFALAREGADADELASLNNATATLREAQRIQETP